MADIILSMTFLKNLPKSTGPTIHPISQGYEQGGLLYFTFEDREMVAVVRERSEFDKQREHGRSLQAYCNSLVSARVYAAVLALEDLIPKEPEE